MSVIRRWGRVVRRAVRRTRGGVSASSTAQEAAVLGMVTPADATGGVRPAYLEVRADKSAPRQRQSHGGRRDQMDRDKPSSYAEPSPSDGNRRAESRRVREDRARSRASALLVKAFDFGAGLGPRSAPVPSAPVPSAAQAPHADSVERDRGRLAARVGSDAVTASVRGLRMSSGFFGRALSERAAGRTARVVSHAIRNAPQVAIDVATAAPMMPKTGISMALRTTLAATLALIKMLCRPGDPACSSA